MAPRGPGHMMVPFGVATLLRVEILELQDFSRLIRNAKKARDPAPGVMAFGGKRQTTSILPSQRNDTGFACRTYFEGVAAHDSCGISGSNAKFPAREVAKGIKTIQEKFGKFG